MKDEKGRKRRHVESLEPEPQPESWETGDDRSWEERLPVDDEEDGRPGQNVAVDGDGNTVVVGGRDVRIDRLLSKPGGHSRTRRPRFRILFLGADANDIGRLHIDRESKAIDEALFHRRGPERFALDKHLAVEARDLQDLLLRHKPHIVHFSGHGEEGLLHLDDGTAPGQGLAGLLALFRRTLRCVFLNACETETLARRTASTINCAVGMSGRIDDEAAIELASGFYRALADGHEVGEALAQARYRLEVQSLEGSDLPRLWRHPSCGKLRFS